MSNMTNYMHRLYLPIIALILGLSLSACGSSSRNAPPQENQSNDWDSMQWDQGSWS